MLWRLSLATPRERLEELRELKAQSIGNQGVNPKDTAPTVTPRERLDDLRAIKANQEPETGIKEEIRKAAGPLDAALTVASGIGGEIAGGLAGIATQIQNLAPINQMLGIKFSPDEVNNVVSTVRDAIVRQPETEQGAENLENIGQVVESAMNKLNIPLSKMAEFIELAAGATPDEAALVKADVMTQGLGKTFAESVFEKTESPIAATVAGTLPTALFEVAGTKGTGKAISKGKQIAEKTPIDPELASIADKGTVLTSDVIPPDTFVGKAFQKVTERIPVIGTGKLRARQQGTRVEALDNIAREFNIDPGSSFEADIVKSANEVFKRSQARAAELRNDAVTALNQVGDVTPSNALKAIDDEIAKIDSLGARGDLELKSALENIQGELTGNFERLKEIRTTILRDVSDIGGLKSAIKSGGDSSLSNVAGALSKDLDEFAINAGKTSTDPALRKAANKWKASNRIFKDNFAKSKETELKKALTKGKVQPEIINTVIKGGKKSELTRLHNNISAEGRMAVKQQILKNSLERANGNPTIFLNDLNRLNNRKAVDTFFRGRDRAELAGLKKFLDVTRRAQTEAASIATQQEVTLGGLLAGGLIAPKPVIAASTAIGLLGRAYESKKVRNLLVKMRKLPPESKRARDTANQIGLLLTESAREKDDQR